MKRILLIVISLIIISSHLFAQNPKIRFEKISINDGLSQNTVLSICQDKSGFLWFATYDGLNRYDGKEFRVFRSVAGDSTSIVHNLIRRLYEDNQGNLWIGTEGGISVYNPATECFTNYVHDPNDPASIPSNRQRGFVQNSSDKLWIATEGGVCCYDYQTQKFNRIVHDPDNKNSLSNNFVRSIFADSQGKLWFGTNYGLNLYDDSTETFTSFFNTPGDLNSLSGNIIMAISEDSKGFIWIGTRAHGLNKYNRKTGHFERFQNNPNDPNSLRFDMIYSVMEDRSGDVWISTYGNGLEKYNPLNNNFIHYQYNPRNSFSFSGGIATCLFEDFSGILWIGTDFSGVNKLDSRINQFNHVMHEVDNEYNLNNNNVHTLYENPADKGKFLWLGTTGGGFGLLDRRTGKYRFWRHKQNDKNSLSNDIVRTMLMDSYGYLWIGTADGLNRFDPKRKVFKRYFHEHNDPTTLRGDIMKTLFEDSDGQLWIGTNQFGLAKYNREQDNFSSYFPDANLPNSINDDIIWCMNEDDDGNLWLGTNSGGINVFDKQKGVVKYYLNDPHDSTSLSNNKVLCMLRDKEKNLWIGTAGGGLNLYDQATDHFQVFTEKDGLVSNTVHAILEDDEGNLWISTNTGLSNFNRKKKKFINFYNNDGLQSHEFHVNSALKSVTGELFFGGINGYNYFLPGNIKQNEHIPPIILTDFKLFNRSVPVGKNINGRVILEKSITETREIVLTYADEVISFEFAALDYAAPALNQYAYKMDGFEKDWNHVGSRNFATYTKLPAGEYTFRVKGSNNSGIWNEEGISLDIIIQPPFWEMLWFRSVGVMLFGMFLFFIYKARVRFIENKRKILEGYNLQLSEEINERKETEKQLIEAIDVAEKAKESAEKANELKSDFLAQMSHEIRSPINIMQSYLSLIQNEINAEEHTVVADSFAAIEKANARLIRTIDLILNMSEIQLGTYQPAMTEIHLNDDVLANIITEYKTQADEKGLTLALESDVTDPLIIGDRYSITQIFANLIDNAIKYTNNGGIIVKIDKIPDSKISVRVIDTGIGISAEYLPNLFEEFSQEERGYSRTFDCNGLGLALVKKYCLLHEAVINVDSVKGEGTTFTIIFPQKEL